ncbi:MAG: FAD/NAD(P)-binding oxidoreductase [Actinomycetota bacterium]|nr:FAD/NAD(P)-binding oxidoreductase [Actinomycetota bacterium]MDP2286995.1 FAD/NAD(P)-binding oxidoreductase [Actinomycetota bacterium]
MKRILILGGGTAGTMAANKLVKHLPGEQWRVTVVDQSSEHLYQPGLLLLPFGKYAPKGLVKDRRAFLNKQVELILSEVVAVEPAANRVLLADHESITYDYLIIATGASPHPDQTPGMDDPSIWRSSVFDFYTLDGATALRDKLASWPGGRLVVHVTEMPIKCPVAPLEFAFLADAFLADRGIRDRSSITYVTPLEGAFTKPVASTQLGSMLDERGIALEPDFVIERIDTDTKTMISMDEREIPFDLLVTVPLNMGADFLSGSGLVDELNYVKVDKGTFKSRTFDNVFALGDASDIPASKAGSVAHFSVEIFTENFVDLVQGRPMSKAFDGHANCFIESGKGKGLLIDFNYDTEPLTGRFPWAGIGPLSLLKETRANHLGKLGFRWVYWHLLLKGRPIPIPALMSMSGKNTTPTSQGSDHHASH